MRRDNLEAVKVAMKMKSVRGEKEGQRRGQIGYTSIQIDIIESDMKRENMNAQNVYGSVERTKVDASIYLCKTRWKVTSDSVKIKRKRFILNIFAIR